MRLGFLLEQTLAPVPGGIGRYARELAAALAASAPPDWVVEGWTAWHRDLTAARVPGVAGPRRLPLDRRALALAWERDVGPVPDGDVIHAPSLLVPPRRRRPLVVTIHDAVPWTDPDTLTRRGVAFHRRMAQRAVATADLVVVPTAAVQAELVNHLPLDPARTVVSGAGVTTSSLRLPVDADRRAEALDLPDGYLMTLATFEPRKGLDVLLDALARPDAPDLPLLVAGRPGWGGVDPAREAARRGLQHRVRVLTDLSDGDLAVCLGRATVLVVPSRAEGFGLPAIEAMALGTPVVASELAALVEVGGDALVTTPVGDPAALATTLTRLTGDPPWRARLAEAGRAQAARHTWAAAAARLWPHYRALVDRSSGPPLRPDSAD